MKFQILRNRSRLLEKTETKNKNLVYLISARNVQLLKNHSCCVKSVTKIVVPDIRQTELEAEL